MSQVEMVLSMLRPVVASMSAADKSDLLTKISQLLDASDSKSTAGQSQNQSNTLSGINFGGGTNNALNFAPVQNQGGNVASNFNQSYTVNQEVKQVLEELSQLKTSIADNPNLDASQKEPVTQQVQKLAEELQKPKPDPTFIESTVTAIKNGLEGVLTLAAPTVKVASLVAKLYGFPVP
jgi:hypothetical protein